MGRDQDEYTTGINYQTIFGVFKSNSVGRSFSVIRLVQGRRVVQVGWSEATMKMATMDPPMAI